MIATVCAAVYSAVVWQPSHRPDAAAGASGRLRLAVLPFTNLTNDRGRQYVAEGLTEEIIAQLGRLAPARLAVIARSSTTWLDGERPPLREIARALQVDYVIEGSVRSVDDRYRIAVRLVETQSQSTVWSELYEGPILDLVNVERQVSQQIGRHLALAVAPGDPAMLARATTSSSPAFDAYLRGRYALARGPEEGFRESVRLFQRAIDHDPSYALAYASLSEAHLRLQDYQLVEPERTLEPARVAALKAYPFARYVLGQIAMRRGAPAAAIDEFSRARASSGGAPKYLAALTRAYLAAGRIDEAKRALDELHVIAATRYVPPALLENLDVTLAARANLGS
jgi:TolB-like protein